MRKSIHTNVAFGIIASVILTIIGVCFTPGILKLMNTDESVLPSSIEYFRYYFLGVSAIIMYNIFNGILNAVGNSKRPLLYLIISSILNVILDLLFIGVFKLGVASAALATTIAQFVSAILCLMHLLKKNTIYHINVKDIKLDIGMFKQILKYGLPNGVQNSVIGFANVIVQANINTFGATAMAACGAFSKIEGFAFLPITSFTMAISTFISQNLGANEQKRAKEGAKFGIISSMILAELIGIVVIIFGPYLISLFNGEEEVIEIGYQRCLIQGPFFFLLALSHCIAAVCRGSGKAIVPMIIMLLVWCVIRVIYISVVMLFVTDIRYIFVAYPLTWFISSFIYVIYYFKSNWVNAFNKNLKTS